MRSTFFFFKKLKNNKHDELNNQNNQNNQHKDLMMGTVCDTVKNCVYFSDKLW